MSSIISHQTIILYKKKKNQKTLAIYLILCIIIPIPINPCSCYRTGAMFQSVCSWGINARLEREKPKGESLCLFMKMYLLHVKI